MNRQRYYCKQCPTVDMWLTLRELLTSMESPVYIMPCGHSWSEQDTHRKTWELIELSEALDNQFSAVEKE